MLCPKEESFVARDSRRKEGRILPSGARAACSARISTAPYKAKLSSCGKSCADAEREPDVWRRTFMTQRFVAAITASILATVLIGVPVTAQKNSKDGAGLTVPFSTTGTNNGVPADIAGTFTVTQFAAQNGKLVAIGTLAATARDAGGVRTVVSQMTLPVSTLTGGQTASQAVIAQQVACGIL